MAVLLFDENCCRDNGDLHVERRVTKNSRDWLFTCPTPGPAGNPTLAHTPKPPAHILLAENDADMRDLLARALAQEGYRITECSNGIQLLDHLSGLLDHVPLEPFDVIISDIRMPGLSGLEILQSLQGNEGLPPTILITAFGDEATHAEARLAGAVVTLIRPFEGEEMLAVVRHALRYRHGACHVRSLNTGAKYVLRVAWVSEV